MDADHGRIFRTGLLLRDGQEHKHHRKIMHEAFTRPVLREYAERMAPRIATGIADWGGSGASLPAFQAFKGLTLDLASSIFVGVDLGPSARKMNRAFEDMFALDARIACASLSSSTPAQVLEYILDFLRSAREEAR